MTTFFLKNRTFKRPPLKINKFFKTWLAQIVATIPAFTSRKIPGQPEISFENVNAVITRDGKSTHDLPYPNHAGKPERTGVQPWSWGFELAWGGPHKVTCILHSHHLSVTLHKKTKREIKNKNLRFSCSTLNVFTSVGWFLLSFHALHGYVFVWVWLLYDHTFIGFLN